MDMEIHKYTLRAECVIDVARLMEALLPLAVKMEKRSIANAAKVEFESAMELHAIKKIISELPYGQEMMLATIDYKKSE